MKITFSHSSLKDFETCRRKYHEVKVLKNFKSQDSEHNLLGLRMHEAAELYIRDDTPLTPEFAHLKGMLDTLKAMPGRKLCEYEMALTEDLRPCGFKADDVWVRGIADLIVVDDENLTARVFDYKTGNHKYADTDQLKLMAAMLFAHMPHLRLVTGGLLFVKSDVVVKTRVSLEEVQGIWWRYRERVSHIAQCYDTGVWNPTQSGLCRKYCPVTSCEFNGNH